MILDTGCIPLLSSANCKAWLCPGRHQDCQQRVAISTSQPEQHLRGIGNHGDLVEVAELGQANLDGLGDNHIGLLAVPACQAASEAGV
jgi:hypothetical protein